jgi:hypothetical protein
VTDAKGKRTEPPLFLLPWRIGFDGKRGELAVHRTRPAIKFYGPGWRLVGGARVQGWIRLGNDNPERLPPPQAANHQPPAALLALLKACKSVETPAASQPPASRQPPTTSQPPTASRPPPAALLAVCSPQIWRECRDASRPPAALLTAHSPQSWQECRDASRPPRCSLSSKLARV